MKKRQTRAVLLLVVMLGILLRVLWLDYARPEPVSDYYDYREQAERLVARRAYVNRRGNPTAFRLPGLSFFLAALMLVSRNLYWLSLGALTVSGVLSLPIYFIAKNLAGGRTSAGLWAAALAAFYPPFIFYSPVLASEPLEALLVISGFAILTGPVFSHRGTVVGSGLLLAGAALTRGSGLIFIAAALLAIAWRRGISIRIRLVILALFLAGAFPPLAGWWARNRLLVGPGVGLSTQGGINFYYAHNPHHFGWRACLAETSPLWKFREEGPMSREGYRLGLEYIRKNPVSILTKIPVSTPLLYRTPHYTWQWATRTGGARPPWEEKPLKLLPAVRTLTAWSHWIIFILAGLSLPLWGKTTRRVLLTILLLLVSHWFFYAVIFHGAPRYGYLIPALIIPPAALVPCLGTEFFIRRRQRNLSTPPFGKN